MSVTQNKWNGFSYSFPVFFSNIDDGTRSLEFSLLKLLRASGTSQFRRLHTMFTRYVTSIISWKYFQKTKVFSYREYYTLFFFMELSPTMSCTQGRSILVALVFNWQVGSASRAASSTKPLLCITNIPTSTNLTFSSIKFNRYLFYLSL